MRVTLDIEDDVLLRVQELAREEGKSTGQVLSELARRALAADAVEEFLGFRPFPRRGGVVTNELVRRIRDEEGI